MKLQIDVPVFNKAVFNKVEKWTTDDPNGHGVSCNLGYGTSTGGGEGFGASFCRGDGDYGRTYLYGFAEGNGGSGLAVTGGPGREIL